MKNLSKIFFLFVLFTFFTGHNSFAVVSENVVTPEVPIVANTIVLATVNIQDAIIVSQENNNFKINFSISNREGIQSGIKYGVRLYSLDSEGNSNIIVDEKVYDESLSLATQQTIKKEISYIAPSILSGNYKLVLVAQNTSGFPFAYNEVDKVTLKSTIKGVEILTNTCNLSLNSDKKTYLLLERIAIKEGDVLNLNCDVKNSEETKIELNSIIETRYNGAYGDLVTDLKITPFSLNLNAQEKKNFSIIIPTDTLKPQIYNTLVSLKSEKNISNPISINYFIDGTRVDVSNVSLNQNVYRKGDIANVTILSSIYSNEIEKGKNGEDIYPQFSLVAKILSGEDKTCGTSEKQTIFQDKQNPKLDLPIKISKICSDPKVLIRVKDSNGDLITEKTFLFSSGKIKIEKSYTTTIIIIVAISILLLMALGYYFYNKKKKNLDSTIPPVATVSVLVFAFIISSYCFVPIKTASADTFSVGAGTLGISTATVNTNKSSYSKGATVNVTASIAYPASGGTGGFPNYSITANGTEFTYILMGAFNQTRTNSFTASSTSGSYNVAIVVTISCSSGKNFDDTTGACYTPAIAPTFVSNTGNQAQNWKEQVYNFPSAGWMVGDHLSIAACGRVGPVNLGSGSLTDPGSALDLAVSRFNNISYGSNHKCMNAAYFDPIASHVSGTNQIKIRFAWLDTPTFSMTRDASPNKVYNYSLPYTVVGNLSVTVRSSAASVPMNTGVNIFWDSNSEITSCHCSYGSNDCSPDSPSTGAGTNIAAKGNPITLSADTTFSVTCGDIVYCQGIVKYTSHNIDAIGNYLASQGLRCNDRANIFNGVVDGCSFLALDGCRYY